MTQTHLEVDKQIQIRIRHLTFAARWTYAPPVLTLPCLDFQMKVHVLKSGKSNIAPSLTVSDQRQNNVTQR